MARVAIIGASNDRTKYGHAAVRAFLQAGWEVFPVNPKESRVEGLAAFRSVTEVPQPVDWICVYVPPKVSERLVAELAKVDAKEVWFNPGSATAETLRKANETLKYKVVSGCSIRAIGMNPEDFF